MATAIVAARSGARRFSKADTDSNVKRSSRPAMLIRPSVLCDGYSSVRKSDRIARRPTRRRA